MRTLAVKYAGFPLWAWLGLAGISAWLILPRFASAQSSAPLSSTPVDLTTGVMMVGYTPGGAGYFGSSGLAGAAAAGPAAAAAQAAAPASYNTASSAAPYTQPGTYDPFWGPGTSPTAVNDAAQAVLAGANGQPVGFAGGPSPSIGSLRTTLMSPFHPDLKRQPKVAHVVQAVGGPAAHRANVHRIARAAGVHPARLLALNPVHTGLIHVR
jgi:hypothetical protein